MKKIRRMAKEKLIGVVVTILAGCVVSIIIFGFDAYKVVREDVPTLKKEVKAIGDSIRKAEIRPIKIANDVKQVQEDVGNLEEVVKKLVIRLDSESDKREEDTKMILKLLVEINNKN